jgi:hypothetical protein
MSREQKDAPTRTSKRLLTLPRCGSGAHALLCALETRVDEGRTFAGIVLRVVSERGHHEVTIYPNEVKAVVVALQRAAQDIETARTAAQAST